MWNPFDEAMMKAALELAEIAAAANEVPVGAIIVRDSQIIARARNQKEELKSALGHAEILALQLASRTLGRWRLSDCVVYTTLEPCVMCAGALLHSRIGKVVFGSRDPKFGGVQSLYSILNDSRANHQVGICEGLYAEESRNLLRKFFSARRTRASPTF